MILTKEVEVKMMSRNINYYKNIGYDVVAGEKAKVKIEHLPINSHCMVGVSCDICNKVREISYSAYNKGMKKYGFNSCVGCRSIKRKKSLLEKYGDENYTNNSEYFKIKAR